MNKLCCTLIMFVALAAATLVSAQELTGAEQETQPEAAGPRVSNVFMDTDLRDALQDIATQAGVTIIPDPTVMGIVTAELDDVPLEKALEIVLAGTGYDVRITPDYYLVYSPDPRNPAFGQISQTRLIKLSYIDAEAVMRLLSPAYAPYARADEASNVIAITAPPALLERIMQDVSQFDTPPQHVLLDVRVVVLERTDLLNLGLQWDFPQLRAGGFTDSTVNDWQYGIRIGYTPAREFTNSLVLTLNMLEQNEEAAIVASPQLMAQDGRPAELSVTTDEYFQIVTTGVFTQAQLQRVESGTILQLTPRIGDNAEVTLEMAVEVSDVVARGAGNLPVVTRRTAQSTVRVENGGTAAVAGLMDSRTELLERRVPGFGRVPVVGRLFRNDQTRTGSKQIAVFVTASVVGVAEAPPRPSVRRPIPAVDIEEFRMALWESMSRIDRELMQ